MSDTCGIGGLSCFQPCTIWNDSPSHPYGISAVAFSYGQLKISSMWLYYVHHLYVIFSDITLSFYQIICFTDHDTNALPLKLNYNSLRWRHNHHPAVSNHQPHGCLLNRLFRRRWKKTSKLRVTGLCAGNSPGPVNSPHKGPVTRKMFPFDDVIMWDP